MKHSTGWIIASLLGVIVACGKPMDPGGGEAEFVQASMAGGPASPGPDRPLAADLAVEPISMLVMFNRLKTPEKLQEALNKKPGQFSHLDLDKDGKPDPLTVAASKVSDGHGFEIRVRPSSGEYVVATMVFDPEWTFLGHYGGLKGGAASTVGRPLQVASPTGAAAPTPVATAPAPAATAPAPGVSGAPAPVGAPAPTPGAATPAPGVGTPAPVAGAPKPATP